MARTPQEIFQHHAEVLMAGDIDGIKHGKAGVREGFEKLLADLPSAEWAVPTQHFVGDILFIEWSAVSSGTQATDGIDTFVFSADGIRAQTVRYTLEQK